MSGDITVFCRYSGLGLLHGAFNSPTKEGFSDYFIIGSFQEQEVFLLNEWLLLILNSAGLQVLNHMKGNPTNISSPFQSSLFHLLIDKFLTLFSLMINLDWKTLFCYPFRQWFPLHRSLMSFFFFFFFFFVFFFCYFVYYSVSY